ncbi:uncharacterized protein N7529_010132 [Penicillium soppii]|uniref:uncharacterized protein n=1 Tax=Penicillium soppii TaxID=69789 RepID=UPI0025470AD3|nr:uncharacterized protein N7529_010132 [Penicillium soppii]KAJ5856188.1 hypothetical protein N7529_010132 [Penicillium soppii]
MADVRSLLRNELASRKGTSQPNTTGNRVTKKRKVDSGDGVVRKKLRGGELDAFQSASDAPSAGHSTADEGSEQIDDDVAGPELPHDADQEVVEPVTELTQPTTPVPPQNQPMAVDEDEWAAFEREVAEPSRTHHAPAALAAEATISAAPITAAELAAQQEQAKASTTRTREAELEGEREDAARLMEEEFDEMEQLEERVRRLKQQREALRQTRAEEQIPAEPVSDVGEADAAESESEDDDEEWDDWRFK